MATNQEVVERLVPYVQSIAILHHGLKTDAESLCGYVVAIMRKPPDRQDILQALHSDALQSPLRARDVLLWRGADKLFRLVNAARPSVRSAQHRLRHVPDQSTCAFCLMNETGTVQTLELVRQPDGAFVHSHCAEHWHRLIAIAARGAPVTER